MTAPFAHGFPDWGRFVSEGDKIYTFTNRVGGANVETLGPFFVGDVPAISIQHVAVTWPMNVDFFFFADQALSQQMQGHSFSGFTTPIIETVVPVLGPWMTIQLTSTAGASQWTLVVASCTGKRAALGTSLEQNVLLSKVADPVGAGVTITTDIRVIKPGPAILTIDTSLATWLATLSHVDLSGTVTRIDTITNLSATAPRPVHLNGVTPRFTFKNNTGAAGSYTAALVSLPMWPGS